MLTEAVLQEPKKYLSADKSVKKIMQCYVTECGLDLGRNNRNY